MTKQKAIDLMVKGKKMVTDDIEGRQFFYIAYENGRFVNHLGEEININGFNGDWKLLNPTFRDKVRGFFGR